jgi:DNA-binding NarL/FixJ family response regulator
VQLGWAGAVAAEDPDSAVDVAVGLRALGHTWASVEVLQATARMGTAGRRQLPRIRAMLHTLARETEPLVTLTAAPTVRGARLTPREAAVARLVADGLADREIAERLGISVRTVESHVARVYAKTGIHDRVELAEALRL